MARKNAFLKKRCPENARFQLEIGVRATKQNPVEKGTKRLAWPAWENAPPVARNGRQTSGVFPFV